MTADIRVLETSAVKAESSVVELLEDFLEKAKTGELQAVALAAVTYDGCAHTAHSKIPSVFELLGAIVMLQHLVAQGQ